MSRGFQVCLLGQMLWRANFGRRYSGKEERGGGWWVVVVRQADGEWAGFMG